MKCSPSGGSAPGTSCAEEAGSPNTGGGVFLGAASSILGPLIEGGDGAALGPHPARGHLQGPVIVLAIDPVLRIVVVPGLDAS